MYFFKIKALKDDLKNKKINQKQMLYYRIAFSVLYIFILVSSLVQINIFWNIEIMLVQGIISFFGIYYAYTQSAYKEFSLFFDFLSAIGWVFLVRSIFFMAIGMFNLYIMSHLFGFERFLTAHNSIIISLIFELILYWRIAKHLQNVTKIYNYLKFS